MSYNVELSRDSPILGCASSMNDGYQMYLKALFDRGLRTQPNSTIVTYTENGQCHSMTYANFEIYCNRLASSLYHKYGIKIGDTVSTFMWNNVRHLALYYVGPCLGTVLNPLNIRLHPKELIYIIGHSQPSIVFIDENLLPNFLKVLEVNPLESIKAFVICGDCQRPTSMQNLSSLDPRMIDFDVLISNYGNDTFNRWPVNLHENTGCFLNYTSGTTGNPKGVLNSHRSTTLRTLCELSRYSGSDCILGLPAMFHACGWGMPFIAMATGCKIILNNTCYEYSILLDLTMQHGITRMCGVPTMIEDLVNKLKANPAKYRTSENALKITEIRCGGAVCPPYIMKYLFDEWGIEVSHAWGMTECMPGCYSKRELRRTDLTLSDSEKIENQLIQGTFHTVVETKLVDSENTSKVLQKNGKNVGELLICGPCITASYYKMDANMRDKYFEKRTGFLKTGDIVTVNEREEMKIVDRSKDLIKSGGEWISSSDMESWIMKLNDTNINRCAVVAVQHPRWQERPVLIIEQKQNNNIVDDADNIMRVKEKLFKHIASKYAKFQIPDDILFWSKIPLTGTGKKSKRTIRDMLQKQNYVLPQLRVQPLKSKL